MIQQTKENSVEKTYAIAGVLRNSFFYVGLIIWREMF